MKFAMFLPNWIGDAAMATPALRAVRDFHPQAEIVGIARPVIADLLNGSPLLDRWIIHHPKGKQAPLKGWGFWQSLWKERFDTAILFPNSLRSAAWAFAAGATTRIGFSRDARRWLLTHPLTPRDRKTPHPVLPEYLRLAEALGATTSSWQMELPLSDRDRAAFRSIWSHQSSEFRSRPMVALNTGGAFGPAKNWSKESFAELAQRLITAHQKSVLIVCGPAEREMAKGISEAVNHPAVVSLHDQPLSIGLTKAAIAASELLVTTDSGPRHFAAAFNIPVITLFGPTHIAWSETNYAQAIHLQIPIACGPCQQRECPLGHHRCMKDLSINSVEAAVVQQFAQRRIA